MNKTKEEKIGLLVWLLVSMGICLGSVRLSLGTLYEPGPGFFFFFSGITLGIFALIALLQSSAKRSEVLIMPYKLNREKKLKVGYLFLALLLYAVGMNYLGFLFSTPLFIGFLLKLISPQRWAVVFVYSILGALISYGIFEYWLQAQLPKGVFGF